MLRLYRHRVNEISTLEAIPEDLGIEFDIRSDGPRVIVTHDPFASGPTVEEFFPRIGRRPCIFNVKSEGVEAHILKLAIKYDIGDFFFLDCSVPAAVKLHRQGERRIAVRYSEMEPAEGVLAWAGKASWVWVDCFTKYPDDPIAWERIRRAFKICVVSPELQGHDHDRMTAIRAGLGDRHFDAACTKRPEFWTASPS